MTENQDESTATGTSQAAETELGPPREAAPKSEAESLGEPRPDLDERQERLATLRKPMGPQTEAPEAFEDQDETETPALNQEGATDPPDDEG